MRSFDPCSPVRHRCQWIVVWLLAACLVAGCQSKQAESQAERAARRAASGATGLTTASADGVSATPRRAGRSARPLATESPPSVAAPLKVSSEIAMPEVLLSADHAGTCRVGVGDVFPDLTLASLQGEPTSLQSHLGERLTIVVFWNAHQPMSVEQIGHLQRELADAYQGAGVKVVTINVANSAEDARHRLSDASGEFVHLHDPDGSAFGQVATTLLPRTYLLRADRRVVWFDMEYSRSTSRELHNAILYVLQQFEQQANSGSPSLM